MYICWGGGGGGGTGRDWNGEQVAQEGSNRSPEEHLAQGINIIWNSKRTLVELLKLLELKPKPVSA